MIRAEGVEFAYPGGPPVVAGVDLELAPGALLAIIGPNGSGKSTLLRLLAGILTPCGGSVSIDGRRAGAWPRLELARRVAYVPQGSALVDGLTVGELVALGRHPYQRGLGFETEEDRRAVGRALELTGTAGLAARPFAALSGGERQRVLLARAIAQDTGALLLDEPTAALDLKHEVRVWEILSDLARQGRAVVGVTHDLNLAALYAPRLLVLKKGRTVAEGTADELLTAALLEDVFETPVRVERIGGGPPVVIPQRLSAPVAAKDDGR